MRRTDISRKLGKIHINLETFIKNEKINDVKNFDTNYISTIVKNMLDLRVHNVEKMKDGTNIIFIDDNFDGVIQKKELYSENPKLRKQKIIEIERCTKASILISLSEKENKILITLLGYVNYTNKEGLKGNTQVVLKRLEVPLNPVIDDVDNMIEETDETPSQCHIITEIGDTDELGSTKNVLEQNSKNDMEYINCIEQTLISIFKDKYYDSVPSDKFINIVIDKLHDIYVVKYLNKMFTEEQVINSKSECYSIIEKLLYKIDKY